jgi:rubrerythrin
MADTTFIGIDGKHYNSLTIAKINERQIVDPTTQEVESHFFAYTLGGQEIEIPQETYKRSTINYTASDFETPTVTCPKCGTQHDFDYPKCPNCKHKYNL